MSARDLPHGRPAHPAPHVAPVPELRLGPGAPEPLGLVCDADGANVAVFSRHAERVELCLFDAGGRERRVVLPERTGPVWHGHVAGLRPGQRYGLRAHGPHAPEAGHRFNPAKLLLDPYATGWDGPLAWHPSLAGAHADDPARPDPIDSASAMAKCVAAGALAWAPPAPAEHPRTRWDRTVIYEAHAKGLTQLWPGLDGRFRGTVEALGEPEVIAHLTGLGVTAIQLMPLQAWIDERALAERGLTNYWGYNPAGFFLADRRRLGPRGMKGLRETVRRLHAAGLEVILDVVFNHTGESDAAGPTLCWRGLDNASYYRLDPSGPDGYANDTGCGNALDLSEPFALRLVLDALRWWVGAIGIDGFRFDLAPTLLRGRGGFAPGSAFLDAVAQDPVLRAAKLIAEPWDLGPDGYRAGAFPAPWAEWNDGFRDTVRRFWRGERDAARALPDALLGSAARFDRSGRRPWSSVNYVAAHDGFRLADLTMYETRRNEANGEGNRDGAAHEHSDNMGVEGPSDDPRLAEVRARRRRALIATALLAQGVPMLAAGDEAGHSQQGNNNAYCQDTAISWIDWARADADLAACVRRCLALRRSLPVLRQPRFLHGAIRADGRPEVAWQALAGGPVDWELPVLAGFVAVLRGAADAVGGSDPAPALVAVNRGPAPVALALPPPERGPWRRLLDTACPGGEPDARDAPLAPGSLALFAGGEAET